MACENCGHVWTGAGYDQNICPACGAQPYRDQPTPLHSDMEMRNMPAPGEQDMGGNPLQEGVWANIDGGWKHKMKRDESFASVKKSATVTVNPHPQLGIHGAVWNGLTDISDSLEEQGHPPLMLNNQPVNEAYHTIPFGSTDPVQVSHPLQMAVDWATKTIQDGNDSQWREFAYGDEPNEQPQDSAPAPGGPEGTLSSVRNKLYMPFAYDASKIAMDFEIDRVVEPGPHTRETEEGVIMQHEDPDVLDEALEKVEANTKYSYAFLAPLLGMAGRALLAGGIRGTVARGLAGGLIQRAVGRGGGQQEEPSAVGGGGVLPQEYYSFHQQIIGAFDHPSTDDKLTERASGDPDDVDPLEFKDGEHSLAKDDEGDAGGTDAFRPEVEQAIEEAMPKLLEYYHSEESGEADPAIQKLLDILQQYDPELLDTPPDPEAQQLLDKHLPKISMQGMGPGMMPANGLQAPGTQVMQPAGPGNAVNPTTQASCPSCGARITPGVGVCPQCGGATAAMPQQNAVPQPPAMVGQPGQQAVTARGQAVPVPPGTPCRFDGNPAVAIKNGSYLCANCLRQTTAANQGPHSIEQIQAVADLLKQTGRESEIPNLIAHPEMYGDELAQIAGRMEPPDPDPDPAPQPMPDPTQMGMPPGAMPAGQPPMGGGMGGMPMMAAADSVAPKCPKCDSHTTGIVGDEGLCQCSRCGNQWSADGFEKAVDAPKTSADAAEGLPGRNVVGVPAADQDEPYDAAADQNMGQWSDTGGEPLRVGQQYEMYSEKYDVPDIIRITALKPDSVEYVLTGEYGLEHRTEVTKQEAMLDGLSFHPMDDGGSDPGTTDPTQMDMAAPSQDMQLTGAWNVPGPDGERFDLEPGEWGQRRRNFRNHGWQPGTRGHIMAFPDASMHTWNVPDTLNPTELMDYGHSQYVQRERGVDPRSYEKAWTGRIDPQGGVQWDAVNQGHPDYDQLTRWINRGQWGRRPLRPAAPPAEPPKRNVVWGAVQSCAHCGGGPVDERTNICYTCNQWNDPHPGGQRQLPRDPWIGDPEANKFTPPPGPRPNALASVMAGKKFTPMEQREFIDESGVARNADKLDLSGTHYEEQASLSSIDDYFLW